MPRILITTDVDARALTRTALSQGLIRRGPVAEVVTLSEIDGIYTIRCTGDGVDECPPDIGPGDTWSDFDNCIADAVNHIARHEGRLIGPTSTVPGTYGATLVLVNRSGQHREVALSVPHSGGVVVVDTGEVCILPGQRLMLLSESLTFEVRS